MNWEILKSKDGSDTLYNAQMDETYHSRHGAIQEAKHVFIQNGLAFMASKSNSIRVLEIGLGTCLNATLTLDYAEQKDVRVDYVGVEKYPVSAELMGQLNYPDLMNRKLFTEIYDSDWESKVVLDKSSLLKLKMDVRDIDFNQEIDLIYYDAFGPRAQEEMWDIEIFKKLFHALKSGGCLVTYCAKGQVRRDLESVGFNMERLPGPPGKREMLRGTKI